MLKAKIKNLQVFYILALLYCKDKSMVDFKVMLREVQLERKWNSWCNLLKHYDSHTSELIVEFINHLVEICDTDFGASLVLGGCFHRLVKIYDYDPEQIEFTEKLTVDNWKALINSCNWLLSLFLGDRASKMVDYFRQVGVMDIMLSRMAKMGRIYKFDGLVNIYPVFSSFTDEERDQAEATLRQAYPIQDDDEENLLLTTIFN